MSPVFEGKERVMRWRLLLRRIAMSAVLVAVPIVLSACPKGGGGY
jgi:hypothetical protein